MTPDLKKTLLLLLIVMAAAAVCVSGCLDGSGNDTPGSPDTSGGADNASNNSSDNTSGDPPANSSDNSSGTGDAPRPIPVFDANLTIVDPVPEGLTFLSTATVKSHGQHIGVTDALFGYQGIYHYGENETPVFLTYYDIAIANTTKTSDSYIQMMKDSHAKQYGSDSKISTIQINGHDAVLFEAAADEVPQYGTYMIAWTLGDSMFATVTGVVDEPVLESLAKATGY